MNTGIILLFVLLLAVGCMPAASATASLSVGSMNYAGTVVKDESITVTSSVTASSVSGTLIVDVTLTDNSGMFDIPSATQQVQFTSDGTKSVSWTVTAASTGTDNTPFTISASGDDDSSGSRTASSPITVKDRPIITVSSSTDVTSVEEGGSVTVSYTVSNSGSTDAADATNVAVALTLPSGFSLGTGSASYTVGTIVPGSSTSGSWVLSADDPADTNEFTITITSTIPGGEVESVCTVNGDGSSSNSGTSGSSSLKVSTPYVSNSTAVDFEETDQVTTKLTESEGGSDSQVVEGPSDAISDKETEGSSALLYVVGGILLVTLAGAGYLFATGQGPWKNKK